MSLRVPLERGRVLTSPIDRVQSMYEAGRIGSDLPYRRAILAPELPLAGGGPGLRDHHSAHVHARCLLLNPDARSRYWQVTYRGISAPNVTQLALFQQEIAVTAQFAVSVSARSPLTGSEDTTQLFVIIGPG